MRAHLAGRHGLGVTPELETDMSAFNVFRRREAARLLEKGAAMLMEVPTLGERTERTAIDDAGLEAFRRGGAILIADAGYPPWLATALLTRIAEGMPLRKVLQGSDAGADALHRCREGAAQSVGVASDAVRKALVRDVAIDQLVQQTKELSEKAALFKREVRKSQRTCLGCVLL